MDLTDASKPLLDEFQVVLFGPGYGESTLIHIGSNKWIIVDSCKSRSIAGSLPLPIEYLRAIEVDPAESVSLIIATHWHDDHIKGLAQIVDLCPNATVSCSIALSNEEFIHNVVRFESGSNVRGGSGAREIVGVLELMKGRIMKRVLSGTIVKSFEGSELAHNEDVIVTALSPSDKQVELFLNEIAQLGAAAGKTRYRASQGKNDTSVVLWISIGSLNLLLGADLEETSDPLTGWSVVLDSEGRSTGDKATIYKVPHHGSITGHSDQVWDKMIADDSIAILTPFNRGRKKLPSETDRTRLTSLSDNTFLSQCGTKAKKKLRDHTVEKTIRETVGKLTNIQNEPGIISIKGNLKSSIDEWDVKLINGACRLQNVV